MENEFFIDYAKLDEIQRGFVDRKINKNMVVTGTAGSGKSLIALHKAKQLSSLGSYAIVVYTKTLKKYFQDGLNTLGLTNVYHYHHWKEVKPRVKYLIVDECQDFSREELYELKNSAEICFFFGDTDQSIMKFRGVCCPVDEAARILNIPRAEPLYKNYRLTIENANVAEVIGKVDDVSEKCERHGERPTLIKKATIESQIDEIIRLKRVNNLSSVGILMPYNTRKTSFSRTGSEKNSVEFVKDYIKQKGEPVEFKYNANMETEMDVNFDTSNIKVMTWWCAKGLQFHDVFLINCDYEHDEDKRRALYVAATRTCEKLYFLYSNRLSLRFFPSESSQLYHKKIEINF